MPPRTQAHAGTRSPARGRGERAEHGSMPRRAEGLLLAAGWGFVQATYRERFPKSSLSCSFPSWDLAGSSG